MGKCAFLAILLPFLRICGGEQVPIRKCCGEYETLSGDGRACVQAPWPQNATLRYHVLFTDTMVPPLDGVWVRRWLPPGIPLEGIRIVSMRYLLDGTLVVAVNSSAIWDGKPLPFDDIWKRRVVVRENVIVRPKPGGGHREATYCVDAAHPPLAPFAMVIKPRCSKSDCVLKCCGAGQSLVTQNGHRECSKHWGQMWASNTSAFMQVMDPETPVMSPNAFFSFDCRFGKRGALRLEPDDGRLTGVIHQGLHDFFFSAWQTCADYEVLANGSLVETLLYCEYSRITRGVYWLLRPLSFASSLLLAAALLSIATNDRIRSTPHGWSLACHAACLLAFNVGQTAFSLTVADRIFNSRDIPMDLLKTCRNLGLSMYFLLIGAAAWLTAVCVNMLMGFGKLQVARSRRGDRWKFLALSAASWALPAVMTSVCAHFFNSSPHSRLTGFSISLTSRLSETRTCYNEGYSVELGAGSDF